MGDIGPNEHEVEYLPVDEPETEPMAAPAPVVCRRRPRRRCQHERAHRRVITTGSASSRSMGIGWSPSRSTTRTSPG